MRVSTSIRLRLRPAKFPLSVHKPLFPQPHERNREEHMPEKTIPNETTRSG
jgi:hypothetical protein